MSVSRTKSIITLELIDIINNTKDIIKILYNKLDYNIKIGNSEEIGRTSKYLLEYENKLKPYEDLLKSINEFNSVTDGLRGGN